MSAHWDLAFYANLKKTLTFWQPDGNVKNDVISLKHNEKTQNSFKVSSNANRVPKSFLMQQALWKFVCQPLSSKISRVAFDLHQRFRCRSNLWKKMFLFLCLYLFALECSFNHREAVAYFLLCSVLPQKWAEGTYGIIFHSCMGGCVAQRKHSCFPTSSSGFEYRLPALKNNSLYCLVSGQYRDQDRTHPCNGFHKCSVVTSRAKYYKKIFYSCGLSVLVVPSLPC